MWLAKSGTYNGRAITVGEHCAKTADAAWHFGNEIGPWWARTALLCGLYHDMGKCTGSFRSVLSGSLTGIDHAIPGAAIVSKQRDSDMRIIADVIAAHHAGLSDLIQASLAAIWTDPDLMSCPSSRQPSAAGKAMLLAMCKEHAAEISSYMPSFSDRIRGVFEHPCVNTYREWERCFCAMLERRILLSCQVDADYTVSNDPDFTYTGSRIIDYPVGCLDALDRYCTDLARDSKAGPDINTVRSDLRKQCLLEGSVSSGACIRTLTAPTGSGKTVSMLSYALSRCRSCGRRRIIIVLPFLSIIDQSADVISNIIPGTIIDTSVHDVSDSDSDARILTETWDAPCVVTTSVQFFGSLFSCQPGDVRKLHNLANSVIVFDEVQSLPVKLMRTCMAGLKYLTAMLGADVLLSTATQPDYSLFHDFSFDCSEIVPNIDTLFDRMGQKQIIMLDGRREIYKIADLAGEHDNVAVICNLRRHALAVFMAWKDAGLDGIYLLSSDFCPVHRRELVKKIKQRQVDGLPVRVAATQCIEAGVDLDFEFAYRALAPLTSILQAAGRQDRNGLHPHGATYVFEPVAEGRKKLYPDPIYERQAMAVKEMLVAGFDLSAVGSVTEYYRRVGLPDGPEALLDAISGMDYETFAAETALIRGSGYSVVTTYDMEVLDHIRSGNVSRRDLRAAMPYCVSSYDRDGVMAHCSEIILHRRDREIHTNVYYLLEGHDVCYDMETGLRLDHDVDLFLL